MQNAAAPSATPAMRHHGMELLKFRFQLLVDQQEGPQRATNVTVASGDDLVDGGFI